MRRVEGALLVLCWRKCLSLSPQFSETVPRSYSYCRLGSSEPPHRHVNAHLTPGCPAVLATRRTYLLQVLFFLPGSAGHCSARTSSLLQMCSLWCNHQAPAFSINSSVFPRSMFILKNYLNQWGKKTFSSLSICKIWWRLVHELIFLKICDLCWV